MKFLDRISARIRQWRKKEEPEFENGSLREFVYLDEVSVYSLIASRRGPIAEQFTDTETSSLQSELGSSLGAGVGVAKAELNSQIMNNQTSGTQVLRKSIVQATFKELYEGELESLGIRPTASDLRQPEIRSVHELLAALKTFVDGYWIIDPASLSRGNLIELEVELEADPIYRVNTVASTIPDLLEENADTFGLDMTAELIQMKSIGRILEKLLAGLVPIRGQAVDYCVMELDGKEWIINHRLLKDIPIVDRPPAYPLHVVGVAEQALFWKDIRRILFSNARYRVLCRIGQSGLQTTWTPVKLAHVLESVIPGFSGQIGIAGLSALASMNASNQPVQGIQAKQKPMQNALVNYAKLIANHFEIKLTTKHRNEIKQIADQHANSVSNQEMRLKAFKAISTYLIESFGLQQDSLIFAKYRETALEDTGIDITGNSAPFPLTKNATPETTSAGRFIDSEFVAIYW